MMIRIILIIPLALALFACQTQPQYDVILKNGLVLDGSGSPAIQADIGIRADTIAAIGNLSASKSRSVLDVQGQYIAPGFINMLSWANESLLVDGRSQSDLRQGVTLEVMGEGHSMGPLNSKMKADMLSGQQDYKFDIPWTSLGGYLRHLEAQGTSTNIASFVGNGTLREYVMGYDKREPTVAELEAMKSLLNMEMEEGAMGISTSLIYVPSGHAKTPEIIALAQVAAAHDGMYISHIRSEEDSLLYAVNEVLQIAEAANVRSEIYHFKASGEANWHLLDSAIALIEQARSKGLPITTDMYMYNASSTGLNVLMPSWAKAGGHDKTMEYLSDPATRNRIIEETYFHVPPKNILLVGFKNKAMRHLIGKTVADIAQDRGIPPAQAVADIIYEDDSRIQAVYFSMDPENIKKKLALPYMSICSDAGSYTNEGVFLEQSTHPRAYGSFTRLLAHYVRDEKVIPLEEAIHRLTALPAANLKLERRGLLRAGYFADLVVFDPNTIQDHATFEDPHQYATGVHQVFVNGVQVIRDGEHTGATPGRFIKGPGFKIKS
jgi:N-acyl-D-amino-acid deacylase